MLEVNFIHGIIENTMGILHITNKGKRERHREFPHTQLHFKKLEQQPHHHQIPIFITIITQS
jgi:hypothetical protein